jgi:hypothetical protein
LQLLRLNDVLVFASQHAIVQHAHAVSAFRPRVVLAENIYGIRHIIYTLTSDLPCWQSHLKRLVPLLVFHLDFLSFHHFAHCVVDVLETNVCLSEIWSVYVCAPCLDHFVCDPTYFSGVSKDNNLIKEKLQKYVEILLEESCHMCGQHFLCVDLRMEFVDFEISQIYVYL